MPRILGDLLDRLRQLEGPESRSRLEVRPRLRHLPGRREVARRRHPVRRALGDLDQRLLRLLRTRGHGDAAEEAMKALGTAGEWGAVWVLIGLSAAQVDRSRRARWLAGAAVGPAAVVANFAVKLTVGRQRPLLEEHPPLARAPSKLSFPSAHATSSVAAATAMGRIEPAARLPLYALAAAICVNRPYLGMHYPSDILAGAVLGTVLGRLAPGVGPRATEERLIDLVVERGAATTSSAEAPEQQPDRAAAAG